MHCISAGVGPLRRQIDNKLTSGVDGQCIRDRDAVNQQRQRAAVGKAAADEREHAANLRRRIIDGQPRWAGFFQWRQRCTLGQGAGAQLSIAISPPTERAVACHQYTSVITANLESENIGPQAADRSWRGTERRRAVAHLIVLIITPTNDTATAQQSACVDNPCFDCGGCAGQAIHHHG